MYVHIYVGAQWGQKRTLDANCLVMLQAVVSCLASNLSWFSCLSLLSSGIIDVYHYARFYITQDDFRLLCLCSRLVSIWFSCFHLLCAGITAMCYHNSQAQRGHFESWHDMPRARRWCGVVSYVWIFVSYSVDLLNYLLKTAYSCQLSQNKLSGLKIFVCPLESYAFNILLANIIPESFRL